MSPHFHHQANAVSRDTQADLDRIPQHFARALSRFDDEERRRDVAAAFENMEASFIAAVLHDQERELPTPAWRKPVARTRLDELVSCLMDRYLAAELLAVLQMAARRGDDALKAAALQCAVSLARAYADAHAEAA